ncbi:sensor domain-containing diguanylate cyclase [Qipengyuania sphaerica]|uniref:sensor domain-containing diguanylate cyclase n=1 Tax=Qipengyuania sphaerica TaxID=2867243 RepID=UPI001C87D9EE|nr:diguanylate cyclase [Qipengyuania sphaerica]MBX7539489.1 GGDEF domain-containing protein [Qipengyuania sphaerica]
MFSLVPAPLSAEAPLSSGSVCHASVKADIELAEALENPKLWTCEGAEFDWHAERHFVRHDLTNAPETAASPRVAEFDRHEFEKLTLIVDGENGARAVRSYSFESLKLGSSSLKALVDLPDPGSRVTAVTFVHEGGWFPEAFVTARLSEEAKVPAIAGWVHILAAVLCGLLLAPIIFDLGFYRALREPFPLYHALFCVMAVIQTAAVSGLLPMVLPLSYDYELYVTYLSLDVMISATFLFAYHFIEDGRLPRRYRRWLLFLPVIQIANGFATTFAIDLFGPWVDHFYFGVLLCVFAAYFYVLYQARGQGSRMAPYLTWGIAPLALVVLMQAVTVYGEAVFATIDETWPQNFALLFEVVATALAVADRFITIRRERDHALSAARDLEVLSEHDELTGLRNRRALDTRFARFVEEGFHAMAVVDLDHFKSINDIHGHPVGDRVIRSAAVALSPGDDPNIAAFRIGGEEFLLLLRGEGAVEKAEERRLAVRQRISADVTELARPVTASMGYLDFSALAENAGDGFAKLYAQVDRLLYDAKCAGRNCTRSMVTGEPDRRIAHSRAAA